MEANKNPCTNQAVINSSSGNAHNLNAFLFHCKGVRRCLAVSFRCLSAARMYIINFLLPHAYECSCWTNSVTKIVKIALCQILTHNSVLSASLHFLTFISYNINYLLYIYNILTEVMKFSAKNLITPMSCNV